MFVGFFCYMLKLGNLDNTGFIVLSHLVRWESRLNSMNVEKRRAIILLLGMFINWAHSLTFGLRKLFAAVSKLKVKNVFSVIPS